MQGTRLPDGEFMDNLAEPGDHRGEYGKQFAWLANSRLEEWMVCAPDGAVFMLCNEHFRDKRGHFHEVEEHEDGTISVLPKPNNSNSIMSPKGWHGYIRHGVWEAV
jgi:hypothetical protein